MPKIIKSRPVRTEKKPKKPWIFTAPRRESLVKAQKVHAILVAIGKEHRNEHARAFKVK